jgi:hypothetical protein
MPLLFVYTKDPTPTPSISTHFMSSAAMAAFSSSGERQETPSFPPALLQLDEERESVVQRVAASQWMYGLQRQLQSRKPGNDGRWNTMSLSLWLGDPGDGVTSPGE